MNSPVPPSSKKKVRLRSAKKPKQQQSYPEETIVFEKENEYTVDFGPGSIGLTLDDCIVKETKEPAAGHVEIGDELLSVNGIPARDAMLLLQDSTATRKLVFRRAKYPPKNPSPHKASTGVLTPPATITFLRSPTSSRRKDQGELELMRRELVKYSDENKRLKQSQNAILNLEYKLRVQSLESELHLTRKKYQDRLKNVQTQSEQRQAALTTDHHRTIESKDQQLRDLQQKLRDAESNLQNQLLEKESELESARSVLEAQQQRRVTIEHELQSQLLCKDEGLEELESTNKELQQQLVEASKSKTELQMELSAKLQAKEKELSALSDQLSTVRQQLAETRKTSTAAALSKDSELTELREQNAQLESQVSRATNEYRMLRRELANLEEAHRQLEQSNAELRASAKADTRDDELEKVKEQLSTITVLHDELLEKYALANEETEYLKADLSALDWELRSTMDSLESRDTRLQVLKEELLEFQKTHVELQNQYKSSQTQFQHQRLVTETLQKDFSKTRQSLERQLARIKEENQRLQAEKDNLIELTDSNRDKHQQTREESSQHRIRVEQLQLQLSEAEADLQASFEKLQRKEQQAEELEEKLVVAKSRNEKLLSELQISESSLHSYSQLLETANAQTSVLKETLRNKENTFAREHASVKDALSQCQSKLTQSQQDNGRLKEQLLEQSSTYKETEGNLSREIRRLKEEISELSSGSNTATNELSHQIKLLEMDLEDRQLLLNQKTKDLMTTKDELKSAMQENEQLLVKVGRSESSLEMVTKQILDLQRQLAEKDTRERQTRSEMQETLESRMAEISSAATAKLQEARNEIVDLTTELKLTSRRKNDLDKECAKLRSVLSDGEKERNRLRNIIDTNDAKLSEFSEELGSCQNELDRTQTKLSATQQELAEAKSARDEAESQVSRLSSKISKLFSDMAHTKDALSTQIDDQQQTIEGLVTVKHRLENSERILGSKLLEAQAHLQDTREALEASKESTQSHTAKLERTIQGLEKQVSELSTATTKDSNLLLQFKGQCSTLKEQVESLECKLQSAEREKSLVEAQLGVSEHTRSQLVGRFEAQIANERNAAEKTLEELRSTLSAKESELRESTAAVRRLEEQERLLQYNAELKEKRRVHFASEKESVLQDYDQCRSDLQDSKAEVARLKLSIDVVQKELDHHLNQSAAVSAEHERTLLDLRKQHTAQVQDLRKTIVDVEQSLQNTTVEKKGALNKLRSVEEELVTLRADRHADIKEMHELKIELRKTNDRIEELEADHADNDSFGESDSVGSPLKQFSKYELKSTCLELQHEVKLSKIAADEANQDASRRSEHVATLTADLTSMSNELDSLVDSNHKLESRLKETMSKQQALEEEKTVWTQQLDRLEQKEKNLVRELSMARQENESLSNDLQTLQSKSTAENAVVLSEKKAIQEELVELKSRLADIARVKDTTEKDMESSKEKLSSLTKQLMLSKQQVAELQSKVVDLEGKLQTSNNNSSMIQQNLQEKIELLDRDLVESAQKCEQLRKEVAAKEANVETKCKQIVGIEKRYSQLTEQLEKEKQASLRSHSLREEAVSKLKEASRVVASQSERIKSMEEQVSEAEKVAALASQDVVKLKSQLTSVETAGPGYTLTPLKKVQELESKCSLLEAERSGEVVETNTLRDDLREARRSNAELKKTNTVCQSRISSLKKALEATEKNLLDARESRDKTANSYKRLEMELESKNMDIEHNKAKLQVLTATTARLKADSLLQCGPEGTNSNQPGNDQSNSASETVHKGRIPVADLERALRDDIFSPNTVRTAATDHLDANQLKSVIRSLEAQIDVLLHDLEKANSTLQEKDKVYAELESLVALHESERDKLANKLADCENQMKREALARVSLQQELARARGPNQSRETSLKSDSSKKRAAGRLLLHAIEQRELAAKAVAFRQWTCQTSAICAVSKQGHIAAKLAKQLDVTREKLVILKKQMKKSRRTPPQLRCIAETAESSP